ncbi:hypothetical protein GUJ93_ZPchr0006g41185 [Zizania palustris]|uniref:Uncharacterized protein n=1 Tax=Zizania palustris TaxID=103762 RepID=A0A8J5SQF3_ZIZPA|nr:hypothetical protein GUJ93_ZPchr0006g41185 [Zizania palustris]
MHFYSRRGYQSLEPEARDSCLIALNYSDAMGMFECMQGIYWTFGSESLKSGKKLNLMQQAHAGAGIEVNTLGKGIPHTHPKGIGDTRQHMLYLGQLRLLNRR